jgi:lipid-binding SYLF domain-containing protein
VTHALQRWKVMNMKLLAALSVQLALVVLVLAILTGCATLSPAERDAKRSELDEMGERAVATLLEKEPQLKAVIDRSVGYVVVDMTSTKIPIFGAGSGLGVVVDKRSNTRSYLKVSHFEVGGGLGTQKFKVIIVFSDGKLLDRVASGAWHYKAGAEVVAGSERAEGSVATSDKGYEAFRLTESGAVMTVTVRVARAKPYLK